MSFGALGFAAIGIYLLVLAVVAVFARRARRDPLPADHVLAGRNLGFVVLLMTIYATAHSGNLIMGFPGAAYRRGFPFLLSAGLVLMVFVAFHLIAPRLRPLAVRHRFVTPGDLFRFRYGNEGESLRRCVGLLMTAALANFLLAQLVALGHVTEAVTGGALPYAAGVLLFAVVIAGYENVGGMRAVAWSDALQGALLFGGIALLLAWFLNASGGLAGLSDRIAVVRPEAVATPPLETTINAISIVVLVSLGAMSYPHAIQRIFAAKSATTYKRALGWMGFLSLFMTGTISLIGVAAIPYLRELGQLEADQVLPRLLESWAEHGDGSPYLATWVFVAALAAIMSTADSILLSLSSVAVRDVADAPPDDPRTTRRGKWVALGVMAVVTLIALQPRLTLWRLLELKMELLVQCAPALVVASRGFAVPARALLMGLCVGTAVGIGLAAFGAPVVYGVHAGTLGLVANLLVLAGFKLTASRR